MCIPAYLKYLSISIISLIVIFAYTQYWYLVFIFGFIDFFIKCPKCHKPVIETKNGGVSPLRWYICDQCGQNLLKCEVEPDEVTNKRINKTA